MIIKLKRTSKVIIKGIVSISVNNNPFINSFINSYKKIIESINDRYDVILKITFLLSIHIICLNLTKLLKQISIEIK